MLHPDRRQLLRTAASVLAVAAATVATLVALVGPSRVPAALAAFAAGGLGDRTALAATLALATPILLCALGALLAFRVGVFSLGQPGQYILGGLTAGVVTAALPGPDSLALVAGLLAGAVVGSLWSLVNAAALRAGLDVLVVSLMLNYLAEHLATFLSGRVFRGDDAAGLFATPRLPPERTLLTLVERTSLHLGIVLALVVTVALLWFLRRTVSGHRIRLFGLNPRAAELAGTAPLWLCTRALAASGALCGLAGAIQVEGLFGRYINGSLGGAASPAWTGVIVAAVVGLADAGVIFASLGLALLSTGLASVEREVGISSRLSLAVQALILIIVACLRRGERLPRPSRATAVRAPDDEPAPAAGVATSDEGARR